MNELYHIAFLLASETIRGTKVGKNLYVLFAIPSMCLCFAEKCDIFLYGRFDK